MVKASGIKARRALRPSSEARVQQALRLREKLVDAVTWRSRDKIRMLLRQLSGFNPGKEEIAVSGLGFLIADSSLWALLDQSAVSMAAITLSKWKVAVRRQNKEPMASGRSVILKAADYLTKVDELETWLLNTDGPVVPVPAYRVVASKLVIRGFSHWKQLDCCDPMELSSFGDDAFQKSVLERAAIRATTLGSQERSRRLRAAATSAEPSRPGVLTSAVALAESLLPSSMQGFESELESDLKAATLEGLGSSLTPMQAVRAVASSQRDGHDVSGLLGRSAALVKCETQRRSGASVSSGLRCWHAFAVSVLGYPETGTLPPRCPEHVELFVAIFRSGPSATNYVGYIKWACTYSGLSMEWFGPSVQMALKGARKRTLRVVGGQIGAQHRLTETSVGEVVRLADGLRIQGFSEAVLVFWEFLLRVQSEGLPIQKGTPSDTTSMDPGRHSGL